MKSETKLLQRFTGVEAALGKAQSTVTLDVQGSPVKVGFFVQFTRQITALTFFTILISLIFLSKYTVLYIRPIDNLTFKWTF